MRALLLVACVLLPGTVGADPQDSRRLHVALTCSITADVGDLLSTFYAFEQRPESVEGNFWAYGADTKDTGRFITVKAVGAGLFHGLLIWRHDDNPVVSEVLLWSNCAWKGFNTGRNIWMARRGDQVGRASLGLTVSWR